MGKVRVKLKIFDDQHIEREITKEELLSDVVERSLEGIDISDRKIEDIFTVLVDGNTISSDKWKIHKVDKSSNVFISPTVRGSDPSSLARGIFTIVAIAAATYFLGPGGAAGLTGFSASLAVAGASVAASLIINGLIPVSAPNGVSVEAPISQSQMYSVSGQSNQLKLYGIVPKVYGQHAIFPNIAANPYIEIEQQDNGIYVQTLFAVYDLGLGPAYVHSVKIGDTPIEDFPDAEWRVVDFNKPAVSQGIWDDQAFNDLTWYKGDNQIDPASTDINGNSSTVGTPQSQYEILRDLAPNPNLNKQKYTLNFVMPQGLCSFASNGDIGDATIALEIMFSPAEGPENWKAINDPEAVSEFTSGGGFTEYQMQTLEIHPSNGGFSVPINTSAGQKINLVATEAEIDGATLPDKTGANFTATSQDYGFLAGTTPTLFLKDTPDLIVGSSLYCTLSYKAVEPIIFQKVTMGPNGAYLGKIKSIGGESFGYRAVVMDRAVTFNFPIYRILTGTLQSSPARVITRPSAKNVILRDRVVTGRVKITRVPGENPNDLQTVQYGSVSFTPRANNSYKVRIRRLVTQTKYTFKIVSNLTFTGVQTRTDAKPINTKFRHCFLEVKIRATGQLNGVISNLSAVMTSALKYTLTTLDGSGNLPSFYMQSNPAWVLVDLLTGPVNKRAVPLSKIHIPSIVEWAAFCDAIPSNGTTGMIFTEPRYECNFVLDFNTTLQDLVQQVCASGQASLSVIDGKYGVLIDRRQTTPVQMFNPRNSRDFSSSRVYSKPPDALKVQYIDGPDGFVQSEVIVYDDGKNFNNSTLFEEITAFGCTNNQQAWRYGRYIMAQHKLRQETMSITVDFEHLVCTRGDYVVISQDVMKVGGFPARCKSFNLVGAGPSYTITFTIDDAIETLVGPTYGVQWRAPNGTIRTRQVTVIDASTFSFVDTVWPLQGDLLIIGIMGQISFDCIVKSIRPNQDLSATLTLVEKADGIYDADSTSDFADYNPGFSTTSTTRDYKPPGKIRNLKVVNNTYRIKGKAYENYIDLDWDAPIGSAYEKFEIYLNIGKGYNQIVVTRESQYQYIVDPIALGYVHTFLILAVSANGKKIEMVTAPTIAVTPLKKTSLPSPVASFSCDITNETMTLLWQKSPDLDIAEYRIRFNPNSDMASWARSNLLVRAEASVTSATVQARTGIYLIKAVDFNGNESAIAKSVITTIPNLFGLNFIETLDDGGDWDGNKVDTEIINTDLKLKLQFPGDPLNRAYFPVGYYYIRNILDLDDIYTVRSQSYIDATGYTEADLMINWTTLSEVEAMSNFGPTDWLIESQYRSTTELNVMSEWVTLSEVETLDSGSPTIWTEWRPFTVGDITGKLIQYRFKLESIKQNVTPLLISAKVTVDTPDRIESYNQQVTVVGPGKVITYDPRFLGPDPSPNVQISIENASPGDYYVFTQKDLTGFTIKFYNASDVEVVRTFDAAVKGYGRRASQVI